MTTVIDRLAMLEAEVAMLTQHSQEPGAIDEHQLYLAARALVVETGRASTSLLQRVLRIGYSRAAALMDTLEENNIIGPAAGSAPQEMLLTKDALSEDEEKEEEEYGSAMVTDTEDLYMESVRLVREAGKASTSYLQRSLRIGYSRAVHLMDLLEERGVIGPQNGSKPREVID